ncbi:MAG: ethanolamine utilization protein EutH [Massilimicrobiota sp.]|nr:ethanolamine utilization protein EutH [Massilimicrobiota sp.]
MGFVGDVIVYIIMICAFISALVSIFKKESEFGKQFILGVETVGTIFLPIAGIMASAPLMTYFIIHVIAPLYQMICADPSISATTFIAVDMGGYQLAETLAQCKESWIMAMTIGYMSGATIVFTIPVALKILEEKDYKYLAFGTMAGFLMIPIGVFIASLMILLTQPYIRETITTSGIGTYQLHLSFDIIIHNLLPLIIICGSIASGLYFAPQKMIIGFQKFGFILNGFLKIIFVLCVIEHFTGFGTWIMHFFELSWFLEPIVADGENLNRALESAGYISMMLCGAFPMVYLLKKYCMKPICFIGQKCNLSTQLMTALIACSANVLASLSMIDEMKAEDKVRVLAFGVCSSFLLGDHLAFTANFQPSLIVIVMISKLSAGICSLIACQYLIIPLMKRKNIFDENNICMTKCN